MGTLRYPLRAVLTYPLPTGGRSLVLVHIPDSEHPFALLDVPVDGPLPADGDCRIVDAELDEELDEELDALGAGVEYMRRSVALGCPAAAA
jgi:hypothetical protein